VTPDGEEEDKRPVQINLAKGETIDPEVAFNAARESYLAGNEAYETGKLEEAKNSYNIALRNLLLPFKKDPSENLAPKIDSLIVEIHALNLAPALMHMQMLYGFIDTQKAVCAGPPQDGNRDGIIDVLEITSVSGRPLVPFNQNPTAMSLVANTYPVADMQGIIWYRASLLRADLAAALKRSYNLDNLSLGSCVVYLFGLPMDVPLPTSVQSLTGVPVHMTVPVACGELKCLRQVPCD